MSGHPLGVLQGGVLGGVGRITHQGSYVVSTLWNINSWASIHEEKWRHVAINMERKVPVHCEGKLMGLNKPRLMDGGKGKSGWKCCVLKGIGRQWEKRGSDLTYVND